MSGVNIRNELGPYKATKLWNDITRIFRTRMPIGRHWRQLRAYDDCFVASEAVDWLFEFLQHHHDAELTRQQVIKLLQKFHRNRYIEDVKGDKYNSEEFDENNRLFRFVALSPIKTPQWPKVKPGTATIQGLDKRLSDLKTNDLFKELEPSSDAMSADTSSSVGKRSNSCPSSRSSSSEVGSSSDRGATDALWKAVVLERLQNILFNTDEARSLHQRLAAIKRNHIRHNMTIVHKNGYVTGISRSELPPSWLISAMRYLAKWPNEEEESSFPEYAGFEKDVLVMIKDYFESLRHPLTTYTLYPILVQAYHLLDKTRPSPIDREVNRVLQVSDTTPRKYSAHGQPRTSYREMDSSYHAKNSENATRYRNPPPIPKPQSATSSLRSRADVMIVYDGLDNPQASAQQESSGCQRTCRTADGGQTGSHSSGQSSCEDQPVRRRHRWQISRSNMTRSASFSHLLGGSRVETAFVADGAHTVYHGSCHKPNSRSNLTNGLSRAQSAYDIDHKPANQAPTFCDAPPTRSVSNRYLAREHQPTDRPFSHLYGSTEHPACSYPVPHLPRHQSLNDVNRPSGSKYADRRDDSERYIDSGSIRLRFHSTPSMNTDDSLPYELFDEGYRQRLVKCLQLVLLFLPPSNRRVLHMLLKLLNKTSSNKELVFESGLSNRRLNSIASGTTQLFWKCIVNCEDGRVVDTETSVKIVQFLVENMEAIMEVPTEVKDDVERRIQATRQQAQPKVALQPAALRNRTNLPRQQSCLPSKPTGISAKAIGRLGITTPGRVFCEQITAEQYKNQADEVFEFSMKELLKNIVEDQKMSVKEKMKRLKQFERTYPEIYAQKFPTAESVKVALDDFERNRPRVKQPLLSRPMNLLRKLR
ncbi:DEP domain-containing protein 1A-like [Watersipora subatra]|uniref:DEP domain-containing protein 1A-like n=1 Tax=Watersipora subatra TaxID=2589382 RepID=UPI00355C966D